MAKRKQPDAKPQPTYRVNPSLEGMLVPVDSLTLDPKNARMHGERNLAAIEHSLKEFGQQKPISIVRGTGLVLAGNGTLEAARRLGWTHVAAVAFDQDDPRAQRGYKLADNRTAELAAWDLETLSGDLRAIMEDGVDLAAIGWAPHEYGPLLAADWTPPPIAPDGDAGPGSWTVRVSEEERETILEAVKLVRGDRESVSDGAALAEVCRAYLASLTPAGRAAAGSASRAGRARGGRRAG